MAKQKYFYTVLYLDDYYPERKYDKTTVDEVKHVEAPVLKNFEISADTNTESIKWLDENTLYVGATPSPHAEILKSDAVQNYFKEKHLEDMVIVATDAGSSKKAYKYAEHFGCPIALVDKRRDGNDDKAIATSVIGDIKGKNALIFDDEVDTAGSIMETVEVIKKFGGKQNVYLHGKQEYHRAQMVCY